MKMLYKNLLLFKYRLFLHKKCLFQVTLKKSFYSEILLPLKTENPSANNCLRKSKYFYNDLAKRTIIGNVSMPKSFTILQGGKEINVLRVNNRNAYNLSSTVLKYGNFASGSQLRFKSTDVKGKIETEEVEKPAYFEEGHVVQYTSKDVQPPEVKGIYYADNEESKEALKLYPAPKNILHNVLSEVARTTNTKSHSVTPNYRSVKDGKKSQWLCLYHLHWPEEVKFFAKDSTKALASNKAALTALAWLKRQGKITKAGLPILIEKREISKLARDTLPVLSLDAETVQYMQRIMELHENQIVPHLVDGAAVEEDSNSAPEDQSGTIQERSDIAFKNISTQQYISLRQYLAKEKVELPIAAYKDNFTNLLAQNQIIIVKGEPGCGKSTRIPQYVLEAWAKDAEGSGEPGRIVVTQPRRIAAISLTERVAAERDEAVGHIVGYQVRLKSNFKLATGKILYCTTGILLRHLQSDPRLSNFTHIILDEAHERDVNTDLLMNLLKRACKGNPKLKLIVMSATIDTDMFSKFFGGAPIMDIPGFTYPVKQHFLESCSVDVGKTWSMCSSDAPVVIHDDVVRVIEYIHRYKKEGAILCFLPGWEDIRKIQKMLPSGGNVAVYCLHSRLQDSEQGQIFSRPPQGVRKIILATNIAETSVTIDDVVYVVDTGIQKEKRFDVERGINCIDNYWVSKASVNQRKGRAGRVQPGESFHLYPRAKYDSFNDYSLPEILRTSLTKIVLDSKVLSDNMGAVEFMRQLPTPPDDNATLKAVEELKDLELLDDAEKLTSLGKTVAEFQLEPKLSKAMVNAVIFKCVTPIVDIVTLFSAESELFVSGLLDREGVKNMKQHFCKDSDHLAMMRILEKWLEIADEGDYYKVKRFCNDVNLVPYKMSTLQKLRQIHFDYLYKGLCDVLPISDDNSDNDELVKAVLFSGVGTVLQHRNWDVVKNKLKNNVNVLLTRNNHRATITSESVNFKRRKYPTNFLLYINETRSNIRRTTLVRECSLITEISVLLFSNRNLKIKDVHKENFSTSLDSDDQVKLCIENTKIELLCDREQAQDIVKCKEAIMAGYRYYIRQLTDHGKHNSDVNKAWSTVLSLISDIFIKNSVR